MNVAGTSTPWHTVVLWFLGAVALLALADPAPQIATALVLLIILGVLLNNWSVYAAYLGLSVGTSHGAEKPPSKVSAGEKPPSK